MRYRYETRYRTATVMEEDALDKPSAAGEVSLLIKFSFQLLTCWHFVISMRKQVVISLSLFWFSSLEADLSLHMLSESPCGSLVVYVIPESSSLLPEVSFF